jgi:hypothetical protein
MTSDLAAQMGVRYTVGIFQAWKSLGIPERRFLSGFMVMGVILPIGCRISDYSINTSAEVTFYLTTKVMGRVGDNPLLPGFLPMVATRLP